MLGPCRVIFVVDNACHVFLIHPVGARSPYIWNGKDQKVWSEPTYSCTRSMFSSSRSCDGLSLFVCLRMAVT